MQLFSNFSRLTRIVKELNLPDLIAYGASRDHSPERVKSLATNGLLTDYSQPRLSDLEKLLPPQAADGSSLRSA